MPCKGVKIVKTTTTNKTTAETVEGVFSLEAINFPENPETGSIHIVKFDDGLFIYEFTNQEWIQKIAYP